MRKHPLIALSALTVAGAGALGVAGPTHLTSSRSFSLPASEHSEHHSTVLASRLRMPKVTGGPDLLGVHDFLRPIGLRLDERTGLPAPSPRPRGRHRLTSERTDHSAAAAGSTTSGTSSTAASAPPAEPAGGVWLALRQCESGDNYAEDSGNGYYGAYQFALSTWYGLGYTGLPSDAPPAVQDQAAADLQARSGWGQWPTCAAELGLY